MAVAGSLAFALVFSCPMLGEMVYQGPGRFPWRVVQGVGDLESRGGLLAVRLPAGSQEIALRFRPEHLAVAVTLTLLGLVATILCWKKGY